MAAITRVQAITRFFESGSAARPIQHAELLDLKRTDPQGFNEISDLAAQALDCTITQSATSDYR